MSIFGDNEKVILKVSEIISSSFHHCAYRFTEIPIKLGPTQPIYTKAVEQRQRDTETLLPELCFHHSPSYTKLTKDAYCVVTTSAYFYSAHQHRYSMNQPVTMKCMSCVYKDIKARSYMQLQKHSWHQQWLRNVA